VLARAAFIFRYQDRYHEAFRGCSRTSPRSQKPASRAGFRKSGRLDLNQRPLGPQPSALPDCATPRYFIRGSYGPSPKRATGIEPALGAWKAPVQPQHFARGFSDYRAAISPSARSALGLHVSGAGGPPRAERVFAFGETRPVPLEPALIRPPTTTHASSPTDGNAPAIANPG
jgi:hypothetical protein